MLGQWRITLRQAEEAAKAGRYDEALALIGNPEVASHHHAAQLRNRLALDLVRRGTRRADADDLSGAVEDFRLAEQFGASPDTLATARLRLADKAAQELRQDLDAGESTRVVERIDALAKQKIGGPVLRRYREVAEAWRAAVEEARRGEFGRARDGLDRAERLASGQVPAALPAARRDLEQRQATVAPRVDALYAALAAAKWPEVLSSADAVLEIVPEHAAARQARTRAWQQIAAIGPSTSGWSNRVGRIVPTGLGLDPVAAPEGASIAAANPPAPRRGPALAVSAAARPLADAADGHGPQGRFLLWVDAVGGYLVCLDDTIVLGRAGTDSVADVPILGDLSRRHATLRRDGDGYVLHAEKAAFVNGKPVDHPVPLRDGDVIRLGSTVELEFRRPSPLSTTARLEIVSRHRLPLAVDGVILMAETCILGPSSQAHISAPGVSGSVVLYRQGPGLACRAPGNFEVNGRPATSRAPLALQAGVIGDGFSFSLEPLGARTSPC